MTRRADGRPPAASRAKGGPEPTAWQRFRPYLRRWLPGRALARRGAGRWLLGASAFLVLFGILTTNLLPEGVDLQVGDVAPRDIVAPREVVDRYRTELLREEAAREALREAAQDPRNWEVNLAEVLAAEERVAGIFGRLRAARPGPPRSDLPPLEAETAHLPLSPQEREQLAETVRQELLTRFEVDLPRELVGRALAVSADEFAAMERAARDLASDIMGKQRLSESELAAVRAGVDERLQAGDLPAASRAVVSATVKAVLRPNLTLSRERVERAQQEARRRVQEIRLREGQIIIRNRDQVEPWQIQILADLGMLGSRRNYWSVGGMFLATALLFLIMGVYLYQHHRDVWRNDRLLALIALLIVVVSGLAKVASLVVPEAGYLIPVALASMLAALLIEARVAIVTTVFLAVVAGLVTGQEAKYVIVALAGGLAGVYSVSRVSQRSDLTRAGLVVSGAHVLAMIALGLVRGEFRMVELSFLGIVNGLLSAILTIGFLPYLESLFRITSSIRLLELSNPNHPLLRKLLMEAPGSYHHSIIVGNLAEAAAAATGADGLLVRVGAQYHDVGKTRRPYFFVENQFGGENPHDKISPSLSTLIIISHVKDGVELAREYRLPEVLIDFIREHHGTDVVKYFYHRALQNAKGEPVDERDFSYPGPLPQSKESAILMLADAVEPAVRSLSRPAPGRIEGLVRKIVKERLAGGQLDESDITLKDLDKIADAFVRVLTGIFHSRVEYPDFGLKPEARRAQ